MKRIKGIFNRLLVKKGWQSFEPVEGYVTRDFGLFKTEYGRYEVTVLASGYRVNILEKSTLTDTLANVERVEALLDFNHPSLEAMVKATGKPASEIANICRGFG